VLLALGLDVVAIFNCLGLSKAARQSPVVESQGSAAFERMRFRMRAVLSPLIAHNFVDALPQPRFAHVKKTSAVLSLGWKKLEIQDSIKANDHMYGRP
jgi:hypothetical protein